MDGVAVVPVGSVVAPTTVADRGARQGRQQEKKEDEKKQPHLPKPNHAATDDSESLPTRDDEGHIDCFG